jgi:hypothetical protein
MSLLIVSVVYSGFIIQGKPFDEPFKNKMSLFTEIIVSIYLYLLLSLTDFTGQANILRDLIALALVYTIGIAVLVNIMIFAKMGLLKCKNYIVK